MLMVPNREKVERVLHRCSRTGRLPIVAIELEREHSLARGDCIVLVVFVKNDNPDAALPITCRHVMVGAEPDPQAIEAGAGLLGHAIARRLRLEVGNDAADMLREAI
jgi:hypothetical protein